MNFNKEHMDKLGHGLFSPMDIDLLPPLYLIYAENPSDSGKVHNSVRQRWLNGDPCIRSSMEEVANLALEGHRVLLEKNYTELVSLINRNFDLRRQMFGGDALGSPNIKMIEVARSVAFCPEGPAQAQILETACNWAKDDNARPQRSCGFCPRLS